MKKFVSLITLFVVFAITVSASATQWKKHKLSNDSCLMAAGDNGSVYVGTNDGNIFHVSSSGEILWRVDMGISIEDLYYDKEFQILTCVVLENEEKEQGTKVVHCYSDGKILQSYGLFEDVLTPILQNDTKAFIVSNRSIGFDVSLSNIITYGPDWSHSYLKGEKIIKTIFVKRYGLLCLLGVGPEGNYFVLCLNSPGGDTRWRYSISSGTDYFYLSVIDDGDRIIAFSHNGDISIVDAYIGTGISYENGVGKENDQFISGPIICGNSTMMSISTTGTVYQYIITYHYECDYMWSFDLAKEGKLDNVNYSFCKKEESSLIFSLSNSAETIFWQIYDERGTRAIEMPGKITDIAESKEDKIFFTDSNGYLYF